MTLRQTFYRALRRQGHDKAEARELATRAASLAAQPVSVETLEAWAQ